MEAANIQEYRLSGGMFGGERVLRLAPTFFEYGRESSGTDLYARVRKEDITDIKHSMAWIVWYRFYVGCTFRIEVKTRDGNIVRIRFSTYFRKIDAYLQVYEDIINWMWDHYLADVMHTHLQHFYDTPDVTMAGLRLTEKGVYLPGKNQLIAWPDVAVKEYESYFAVYDQNTPEVNKTMGFGEWESEILLGMLEALKQK